ncbi:MAG: hypothetical protein JWM88_933 [Verrucomicrobia bacterium]|nr:hypothetical protein [Verrucomicrobiota bacterium]
MNYIDADGDLTLEADEQNGVLRLKAVATFDDPVDLTPDAARELAQQLLRLADEIG